MTPRALLDAGADALHEVLKAAQPADAVLAERFRRDRSLGARDRHALSDMVHAVLRRRRWLEHLARTAPPGLAASARPGVPSTAFALAVLGWGDDEAFLARALDEAARRWRADALARAPDPGAGDELRLHLPNWIADDLRRQLDDAEVEALATALNQPAPLDLRVNTLKGKRDGVQAALAADGIASAPTRWSPWGLRVEGKPSLAGAGAVQRGEVEVQDEGSQLLALLVGAKRGEVVVDFCAGAGGKSLALGAAMRDTGRLYALDTSGHRLDALRPRLARSGLTNVHTMHIAHERDERLQRLAGKVDRVLVDAPCSGLGTLRRHPDLRWRQRADELPTLAARQLAILTAAAGLLKPGGRLVYATCSLLTAENDAVASAFDASAPGGHAAWTRLPAAGLLTAAGVAGVDALVHGAELRLWPHRHGTDGFFAAIWQKR